MKKIKNLGFTFFELIITIALMGILATILSGIMSGAFRSYIWTAQNSELMSDLDYALQRIEGDLQNAIPLSARTSTDGRSLELLHVNNIFVPVTPPSGTAATNWPVFVWDVFTSSTLRNDLFVMNHKADYQLSAGVLNFDCPRLGNAYCPIAGYPTGGGCSTAVSAPAQQAVNASGLVTTLPLTISNNNNAPNQVTGNITTLVFNSPNNFPSSGAGLTPAIVFLYAAVPVLYRCETDGKLRRYTAYGLGQRIYNPALGNAPGPGAVVLSNVKDCKFTVDGTSAKFVDLWIQLNKLSNTIDFASRIHVDISP